MKKTQSAILIKVRGGVPYILIKFADQVKISNLKKYFSEKDA
jgi:hypothetical protein